MGEYQAENWVASFEVTDSGIFEPPRPGQLQAMTEAGTYPIPLHCEFHVGELDWQSNPKAVTDLASAWGHTVTVVPGGEHRLEKSYVSDLLDRWLKKNKGDYSALNKHQGRS
jgi:hypothetical protein